MVPAMAMVMAEAVVKDVAMVKVVAVGSGRDGYGSGYCGDWAAGLGSALASLLWTRSLSASWLAS